jgi:hypothetical protein
MRWRGTKYFCGQKGPPRTQFPHALNAPERTSPAYIVGIGFRTRESIIPEPEKSALNLPAGASDRR